MKLEIHETTDYSIFSKLKGNRDLKSVQKIIDSIEKVGYILSPVCVNEKMEIIDGQNRVAALERLNLPIHYYVVEGIGIEEARQMNIGRKDWTPSDYVQSYAEEGKADYVRFRNMMLAHPEYTLQELYGICKGIIIANGWAVANIKTGDLSISKEEIEKAELIIKAMEEIKPILSKLEGSKRLIITSYAWILRQDGVSKTRVYKVLKEKYPLFAPAVKPELLLKEFSDYYNNRYTKVIWFDVKYREFLRDK